MGMAVRADEPSGVEPDPSLWGVYSQLVDTTRQSGDDG